MLESTSLRNPIQKASGTGEIRAEDIALFTMNIPFTALER